MTAVKLPEPPGVEITIVEVQFARDNEKSALPAPTPLEKLLTRFAILGVPRPVARSKPGAASQPERIPVESPEVATMQLGLFFTQGCEIVPLVTSWNTQVFAGLAVLHPAID